MKLIPLTQGKFSQVDDEDYEWLMRWKWSFSLGYARRTGPGNKAILMHREILKVSSGLEVDHQDLNGLNNQRYNLRSCNRAGNTRNRGKNKNNSSGYKGVWFNKSENKFQSYITVDRVHKYLGAFDDPVEAAKEYDRAAIEFHGEFAKTNF